MCTAYTGATTVPQALEYSDGSYMYMYIISTGINNVYCIH